MDASNWQFEIINKNSISDYPFPRLHILACVTLASRLQLC